MKSGDSSRLPCRLLNMQPGGKKCCSKDKKNDQMFFDYVLLPFLCFSELAVPSSNTLDFESFQVLGANFIIPIASQARDQSSMGLGS